MLSPRPSISGWLVGRGPAKLVRRVGESVRRSLRTRMVLSALLLGLVVAIVFSVVSMISVRSTMIEQASNQSRKDFSETLTTAQKNLESADITSESQSQRLVVDLASQLQSQGSPNLMSVSMRPRDSLSSSIVAVSTDSNSLETITSSMEDSLASARIGTVFYQAVQIPNVATASDRGAPGAVLASVLRFPGGDEMELFSLYSFSDQQRSLVSIQHMLFITCIFLSLSMGFLAWFLLRSVVHPVQKVASAAKSLASGDLEARVNVDRADEIGVLQRSFNAMAGTVDSQIAQLEEASTSQRRFVSDVSHELRTPVTTIRMAADLLISRRDSFDSSTARTVELLGSQTTRFEEMLAELLEISRYDAKHATFTAQYADLREPVLLARDTVLEIAHQRGVSIRMSLPDAPVMTFFDHGRITGAVRNLLSNAIDFSNDHPLDVTLVAGSRSASIAVRDRGTGIGAADLPHIFDRFWRADPSRSRLTGGTGLGLSIVRQNVELHHGDLQVRSIPGEGTCFIITIPLIRDQPPWHDSAAPMLERVEPPYPIAFASPVGLVTRIIGVPASQEVCP